MRTTLSIDDDVLMAPKNLAKRERRTIGEVLSYLARQALQREPSAGGMRNGIRLLPAKANSSRVTMEQVNQIGEEWPGQPILLT